MRGLPWLCCLSLLLLCASPWAEASLRCYSMRGRKYQVTCPAWSRCCLSDERKRITLEQVSFRLGCCGQNESALFKDDYCSGESALGGRICLCKGDLCNKAALLGSSTPLILLASFLLLLRGR